MGTLREGMTRLVFIPVLWLSVLFCPNLFAACIVITEKGNVRSGPGEEHKVIGQVEGWELLEFSRQEGDWFISENQELMKVFDRNSRKTGWAFWQADGPVDNVPVTRPLVGTEAVITTIDEKGCEPGHHSSTRTAGMIVEYMDDKREAKLRVEGAVSTVSCQKVVYHPFVKLEEQRVQKCIHKKTGKVIKDSCQNVERRASAIKDNPHWSEDVRDCVLRGKIRIGMTDDQIKASWGAPYDTRRHVGSWGVREQWAYGDIYYLNFENGVLTSWSED